MELSRRIKITSFNCCGVTNKLPIIKELCDENDIVLLQETWLMPHNLAVLEKIHANFSAYSISAVDCTRALVGRPYGGLSVLWKNSLSNLVKIVPFDDSRILGIDICSNGNILHILNVYLPYYSYENYDIYLEYVGKISSIIEHREHSETLVFGDFNADVNGEFYNEWNKVCNDYEMIFADVSLLPDTSVTHVNNFSLTATWLDH